MTKRTRPLRLSLATTNVELDRDVVKSGRMVDRLRRANMALAAHDVALYDAALATGMQFENRGQSTVCAGTTGVRVLFAPRQKR